MIAIYLIAFTLIAIAADWLVVLWHDARDKLDVMRVITIGMIVETINWAPLVVAIDAGIVDAKWIAAVNILGTVVGSGAAIQRLKRKKNATDSRYCTCMCADCGLRRRH